MNASEHFEPTPLTDSLDTLLQAHATSRQQQQQQQQAPRRDPPRPEDFHRLYSFELLNQYTASSQWRALLLATRSSIQLTPKEDAAWLRYWVYRILGLINLGHKEQAQRELQRLGSFDSCWPYELRILWAQLPGWCQEDWLASIDRLLELKKAQANANNNNNNSDQQKRSFRVTLLLVSNAIRLDDFELATEFLSQLSAAAAADDDDDGNGDDDDDPQLLSSIARLCLQMGALAEAERLFVRVETMIPRTDQMALMNRALYAVALGKWESAHAKFSQLAAGVAARNNRAVCELYLGDPQKLLQELDQLMGEEPLVAGTSEEVVFNYCTGLDLLKDGAGLRDAKVKKLCEVGMWAGDGFDTSSFNI